MRRYAKSPDFRADAEWEGDGFDLYLDNLEKILKEKKIPNLIVPVARELGRISKYADTADGKRGVYLTLVSGKSQRDDSRSTIFFYRTHFGQAGNLLSRILEKRPSTRPGKVIIQSDCANANNLETDIRKFIVVLQSGCYAHGRRPFAKYCNQDENLSFYLLRAFALIAANEEKAFRGPITGDRIIHYRKYERIIWKIIREVCNDVINGKKHRSAQNGVWKKGSKLFDGCQYIINNYDKLILYLDHPELFSENICIERNLRPEKIIEDAAKFRASENGRVALDIIRTFIATCRAAEMNFKDFLKQILEADPDEVSKNPERFTPFAFANKNIERAPPAPAK